MSDELTTNWVRDLAKKEIAVRRIYEILNRTGSDEDGETIFVPVKDLAEVYAILFFAFTEPGVLEDVPADTEQAFIGGHRVLQVKEEHDDGSITYESVDADGEVTIGIDLY